MSQYNPLLEDDEEQNPHTRHRHVALAIMVLALLAVMPAALIVILSLITLNFTGLEMIVVLLSPIALLITAAFGFLCFREYRDGWFAWTIAIPVVLMISATATAVL